MSTSYVAYRINGGFLKFTENYYSITENNDIINEAIKYGGNYD